jgi:4-amino-4-deoxy-L-arabinose transferase-like glycosyltransferase
MLVYTAIFLCVFAFYLLIALKGEINAPPEVGDGPDYDAIAFNISHLRGFGDYWDDPDWRRPYLQDPSYQSLLTRHSGYYPTAYRPPAMPYLLAMVYGVVGRNFAAWRILSCAIMAGAATAAAATSAEFAGSLGAIITAFLVLQCPQLTAYSHMFMTESLATFLVCLLAWTWLKNEKTGWTTRGQAALGILLGTLFATRSIFLLWVPVVALFVPATRTARRAKNSWRGKAICFLFALLVITPWSVRNVVVTKNFMPFGTLAQRELPAGFGPAAIQSSGYWTPAYIYPEGKEIPAGLDGEVQLAKTDSSFALHWMVQHPVDVIRLMFLHVWQEAKPLDNRWLLYLGTLSAFTLRKSPGVGVIVILVALNIVSVALTWSVGGRFMVPVQPLLAALVGAMISRQIISSLEQNT